MKKIGSLLTAVLLAGSICVQAGEVATAPHKGSPEFERLKGLVGVWEGESSKKHMEGEKLKVEYSLTSGGSALEEKLFPGTPHEMVSIYHDRDGKLCMTHYCMMGNQPRLELKTASAEKLELVLAKKDSGLSSPKELHMHSLTIAFSDPDHITETWTSYESGKLQESSVFQLSRSH